MPAKPRQGASCVPVDSAPSGYERPSPRPSYPGQDSPVKQIPKNLTRPETATSEKYDARVVELLRRFGELYTSAIAGYVWLGGHSRSRATLDGMVARGVIVVEERPSPHYRHGLVRHYRLPDAAAAEEGSEG